MKDEDYCRFINLGGCNSQDIIVKAFQEKKSFSQRKKVNYKYGKDGPSFEKCVQSITMQMLRI